MDFSLRQFFGRDGGAVTVDYVPLVSAAVALGVAAVGAVFTGAQNAGDNVGEATRSVEVGGQADTGGGGGGADPTPPASGGSGSTPGGPGSFVPGEDGGSGCQGVPGVSCSGLGDGTNPGAGSDNNNAGDTPGGSGVNNPGGGGNNSGGGGGNNSGGGGGNSGGGNSGNGNSGQGNGAGNSGGGNSGNGNSGQGNGSGNSGGGGNNGQGNAGQGGGDDGSAVPSDPDFVVPSQTLTAGWDDTVTSDWLEFGNGGLPGSGPVGFTVSGDGNPTLQTTDGQQSSEGQIPSWGTNIVMETPACGSTSTVVIEFDTGQTGVWEVSRPSWPASWGSPPANC